MAALPKDMYWRGKTLHYRFSMNTIEYRGSLRTDDPSTAKLILAEVKKKIVLGIHGIKKMPLFSTLAETCLDNIKANFCPVYYRSASNYLNIHIIPAIGDYAINKIDSEVINKFMNKFLATHAKGSANNIRKFINLVFNYAIAMDYIKEKPYKLKQYKVSVEPKTLLDIKNVYDFIDYCYENIKGKRKHNQTAVMIAVAVMTGMRSGEIIASRWEWFDEVERKLTVRAKKTGTVRVIPISQFLIDKLVEYRNDTGTTTGLMFPGDDGNVRSKDTLYRVIRNMAKKFGLVGTFGPHSCRHSFMTIQHDIRTPMGDISKLVGHTNLTTTMRYIHPTAPGQVVAQDRMAEAASAYRTKTGTDGK